MPTTENIMDTIIFSNYHGYMITYFYLKFDVMEMTIHITNNKSNYRLNELQ